MATVLPAFFFGLMILCLALCIWKAIQEAKHMKREQGCEIYCPGCKSELISNGDYLAMTDQKLCWYDCRTCHVESWWDFGTPAPTLIATKPETK